MLHRRRIWLKLRQKAYDLRDRNEEQFRRKINSARTLGNDALAKAIEEQRASEYTKEKSVIDRLNLNCPVDVWEATPSAVELQQQQALFATRTLDQVSTSEIFNFTKFFAALAAIVEIFLPPGEAVRSTPRRPGAPSACPCIDHI